MRNFPEFTPCTLRTCWKDLCRSLRSFPSRWRGGSRRRVWGWPWTRETTPCTSVLSRRRRSRRGIPSRINRGKRKSRTESWEIFDTCVLKTRLLENLWSDEVCDVPIVVSKSSQHKSLDNLRFISQLSVCGFVLDLANDRGDISICLNVEISSDLSLWAGKSKERGSLLSHVSVEWKLFKFVSKMIKQVDEFLSVLKYLWKF